MTNKVCYYYQTFVGLDKILEEPNIIDTIIVSSIHFGNNKDGTPYIHLNDLNPDDKKFDILWNQTKILVTDHNKEIILMLGGAGGAYGDLFNNYTTYYPMLLKTIKSHNWITGIDLDIEESVSIDNVKMLIRDIHSDFGDNFVITMAPLAGSLMGDGTGMGGFIYKDLYNSPEGKFITRFNVQAYGSYSFDTFQTIINNGYPAEKIVLGMVTGQFNKDTFKTALNEIKHITDVYTNIGGVFCWEYCNSPPDTSDPSEWARLMSQYLHANFFTRLYKYIYHRFF